MTKYSHILETGKHLIQQLRSIHCPRFDGFTDHTKNVTYNKAKIVVLFRLLSNMFLLPLSGIFPPVPKP